MTQLTDNGIYCIEIPSMAFGIMINNYGTESELMYMLSMSDIADDENSEETLIAKPLPPGSYEFLFCTKGASEEDARKVVAWIEVAGKTGYYDYTHPEPYRYLDSQVDSIASLLRSKSLDDKKNFALIRKL